MVPSLRQLQLAGVVPIFTTQRYGAKGDGIADDTAAIQAALDDANLAGGGYVFIPAGIYKVTNTLLVPSNTKVVGAGRRATILRATGTAFAGKTVGTNSVYSMLAMVSVANASVESLTVDKKTNPGTGGHGIIIDHDYSGSYSTNCTVKDCEVLFSQATDHYLIWSRKAHGSKILHNYVDGGITTNNPSTTQEGIEVYGGDDVLVEGNTATNIGNNAYYCNPEPTYSGAASNIRFINNFASVAQWGIHINPGSNVSRVIISGNQIMNPWQHGIEVSASTGITIDDLKIVRNQISGGSKSIFLNGSSGCVAKKILVSENSCDSSTASNTNEAAITSIYFDKVKIVRNQIATASAHGIYAQNCTNIDISGNTIDTVQFKGVSLNTVTKSRVCNNDVFFANQANASHASIYASASSDILISGNMIDQTYAGVYAVDAVNSGDDRITIQDNTLLFLSTVNPTSHNGGTNPNSGVISPSASATTTTVTNTLVNRGTAVPIVIQKAGTPLGFTINVSNGAFVMTWASAAVGNESYVYQLRDGCGQ